MWHFRWSIFRMYESLDISPLYDDKHHRQDGLKLQCGASHYHGNRTWNSNLQKEKHIHTCLLQQHKENKENFQKFPQLPPFHSLIWDTLQWQTRPSKAREIKRRWKKTTWGGEVMCLLGFDSYLKYFLYYIFNHLLYMGGHLNSWFLVRFISSHCRQLAKGPQISSFALNFLSYPHFLLSSRDQQPWWATAVDTGLDLKSQKLYPRLGNN